MITAFIVSWETSWSTGQCQIVLYMYTPTVVEQRINAEVQIKVLCEIHDPLGIGPSKGNQGTTQGKEKLNSFDLSENRTHDLQIRSTVTLPTELRGCTEKAEMS